MSLTSHITSLEKKHAELEQLLHEAHLTHMPSASIKKQKLAIKDEILKAERLLEQHESQAA